jgi:short-subunit dehydrogenase
MANILIIGASRGLGAAFSVGIPTPGDTVWLVSRTRPDLERADGVRRQWVEADLASPDAHRTVADALAGQRLDALIYNAGIWEQYAFTREYDFESVSESETQRIIAVNLTSAITCVQALLPNLRQSKGGKIILIGSTSGLENGGSPEVAYAASKFGLRGLGHALRENLRSNGIAVTCINAGEVAAEIAYERGPDEAIAAYGGTRIPVQDLAAVVRCVMGLSNVSCVKEIDIPAITDRNA